jgi:subtilisin family serine protease
MQYRIKSFAVFVAAAVPLALLPVAASAQGRVPAIAGEYVAGELLVGFAPDASSQDEDSAARSAGAYNSTSLTSSVRKLRLAKGNEAAGIATLLKHSKVRYAEPNYIVHATQTTPNDPQFSNLWAMRNTGQVVNGTAGTAGADISATSAWDISKGSKSIVVGDVDTGIDYNHSDLSANIWSNSGGVGGCAAGTHGYNAITTTCEVMDDNNHGTHTAGTIGAVGNNLTGVTGVNWTTSLMGLKFLDKSGSGSLANAISAIDFAVTAKNKGQANVRALNNSWGGGGFSQALLDEINKAGANDILFVAAAGNNSLNHANFWGFPCDYGYWYGAANVVCVAASDQNDNLASFSDYGTGVHLAAPGTNILSTIPNNGYAYYNGTSMATPHVTGAAALILSACTTLNTAGVKNAILNNVDTLAGLSGLVMTNGRLNLNKAIRSCAPTAPDFSLSANPTSQTVTQGASAAYTITVTPSNGFAGTVTFAATGFPTGASTSYSPATVTGSGTSTLTVATGTATPGTYTVRTTGTSGALTHTVDVTLVINAPPTPDFSLSASSTSQTVVQGNSTNNTITVTASNGFTGTVTFSASGLPTNATASYNPASVTTSGNTIMTVATAATTPTGTYTVTTTGTSGSLTHTVNVTLVVNPPADYSLSVTPSSVTVNASSTANYTVNINRVGGFTSAVQFSLSALPSGAAGSFSPNPSSGASSALSITTSSTTPTGSYPFTITGVGNGLTHTVNATLVVNPAQVGDFSLSVSPSSQAIDPGNSGTYTVTINRTNGFTGTVTFTVTGLRNGATYTCPASTGTGTTSTLTITVPGSDPGAVYAFTITGSSGSLSHSTTAQIDTTG